jgi:cytochrome c-type biogenesis protein
MSELPLPLAAFLAGVISFLSPCVLPLVPGYVSLISGVGIEELKGSESRVDRTVMLSSLAFVVGFSIVFIALGAIATTIGALTRQYFWLLSQIAGIIIILFGLHLTGLVKIKALYADKRMHNAGSSGPAGAFVVGFAFAFGWTPCIGPILATVLALAASQENVGKGIGLLAVYSLGLAVPFILTSLGIDRFLHFYTRFRRHLRTVEVMSGILLIAVGTLVFLNKFTVINGWLNRMYIFQKLTEYL